MKNPAAILTPSQLPNRRLGVLRTVKGTVQPIAGGRIGELQVQPKLSGLKKATRLEHPHRRSGHEPKWSLTR